MNYAVVMATTNKLDAVEPSLRTPGRFDKEIEITVPNRLERKQVSYNNYNHCIFSKLLLFIGIRILSKDCSTQLN